MGAPKRDMNPSERPELPGPVRTCAGCGQESPKGSGELVRLVRGPEVAGRTEVAFDLSGTTFGRGAYVHPSLGCLERAAKSGFSKAFKTKVTTDVASLSRAFQEAATRRVEGLLVSAKRLRAVALGTDATFAALRDGAPCVVVATDAKSVVERRELADAITRGLAVSFGTKGTMGALFDRDEVALVAILHVGLADEIKRTCRAATAMTGSGSKAVWVSSEGR